MLILHGFVQTVVLASCSVYMCLRQMLCKRFAALPRLFISVVLL